MAEPAGAAVTSAVVWLAGFFLVSGAPKKFPYNLFGTLKQGLGSLTALLSSLGGLGWLGFGLVVDW
jgi:hypothetical protein